jgi:phospholipase C
MQHDDEPKSLDRRRFLIKASQTAAVAAGATFLPIQKALAIPAQRVTGTIQDVQHVVILMQENRSFDHYFGTLSGVNGFGDRAPIPLPGGKSVWHQLDAAQGELLPFHLDTKTTTAMRVPGTPHTWPDAQLAWDQGRLYQWPRYKNFSSMGYYQEADIPFQRALAEAFTLCDAHHCSIQTGTLPNRVVFMTGTNATPGIGAPATSQTQALIDNSNNLGANLGPYTWTTYPERLQAAGVSWRIYQDPADNWGGLLAPWESFAQYQSATEGDPLYEKALRKWTLDDLREQVLNETLPQVSWVVPHRNWSEHPSASSPLQGASFTQQVLEALTANPEVWSKTVLIITFDENDGLFDHAPPPAVPSYDPDGTLAGKTTLETPIGGEYYTNTVDGVSATRPYGMGPRVPMYIVSPWTRGGWVCSQVFDHTSTIRFLEARFGVAEPNITPWHRAVSGDLTSAFDFAHANEEELPELPDMSYATVDTLVITGLPAVSVPELQTLPVQDQGLRYARALPYVLHAHLRSFGASEVSLRFDNSGRQGAVFHVYDRLHLERLPRRYTVEAGKSLTDRWDTGADAGLYDLWILGPGGFHRHFTGSAAHEQHALPPELELRYEPARLAVELVARNSSGHRGLLSINDAHESHGCLELELPRDGRVKEHFPLRKSARWYDLTITAPALPGWSQRFAGRLETGRHGFSDPLLGR